MLCLLHCTREETLFLLMQRPVGGWGGALLGSSLGLAIAGSSTLQEPLVAAHIFQNGC